VCRIILGGVIPIPSDDTIPIICYYLQLLQSVIRNRQFAQIKRSCRSDDRISGGPIPGFLMIYNIILLNNWKSILLRVNETTAQFYIRYISYKYFKPI
jgi:hypothetical protein